jgi:hypothetical protein
MCPACFAAAAWITAGASSAGGLAAFIVTRRAMRKPGSRHSRVKHDEETHTSESDSTHEPTQRSIADSDRPE